MLFHSLQGKRDLWIRASLIEISVQSSTREEIRGRVVSIWATVTPGLAPVGSLLIGSVARAASAPFALAPGGVVCYHAIQSGERKRSLPLWSGKLCTRAVQQAQPCA